MNDTQTAEIADLIRARSSAGELTAVAEILLESSSTAPDGLSESVEPLIRDLKLGHKDIKVISDKSGSSFCFSDRYMTRAYAAILVSKRDDFLQMLVDVIREHSRTYPRPVPISLFLGSPFDLSKEQVQLCLNEIMIQGIYRDIMQTTTSVGNVYAYSTKHLDPDYAAMLAEWVDVGQVDNP